ncbi:MAG: type I secretion system permease/ATPase [Gammaproteobacteria bacterium]|nr:MAG: type I secretion system permease/ATPase [Gammaproteobacteria bacterium]
MTAEVNSPKEESQRAGHAQTIDTGLACLVMLSRLHGIPADPEQLRHEYGRSGETFDNMAIQLAAKGLKLKVRQFESDWSRLSKTHLPAMAKIRNEDSGERNECNDRYVILARMSDDHVLIQDPTNPQPQTLNQAEFEAIWTGELILITRRAELFESVRQFDFSWFIPSIIKYKKLIGEVLFATFFIQLFALITPLFFQVVIDKVLVHRGLTTLDVLAFGLLVVSIFDVVLGGLRAYVFAHTTNRIDVTLGARLFRHLMSLPVSYFGARRVGDTVARVRELESIRNFLTGSALMSAIDVFFIFVFLVVMYYYSPILTWIVMGTIPFYVLLSVFVTPVLRTRLHEKFNRGAENQAFLVETVTGIETVKAGSIEPQNQRRWEEQLAGYVKASFKASNLSNIASQSASFINKIMILLILWVGAHLVIAGELSVGMLVAFNMLAARVSGPILKIVQLWQEFQQAGISVQRLGDILNAQGEPKFSASRGSLPNIQGNIELDHVNFRYRADGPEVLSDVCLQVKSGEVVGIVGRSGSGKSTLTKLIQRLHVPESGRVLVDGVDLAMVDTSWLRRNIGVVLQENFLFNRSIRDNIALADPTMPMEVIVQAAKMAGAHEFILGLPEGYDTIVGERGGTLSGGQRQRIAIARALVTNPKILIFDEATSALDYESERIIANNMRYIAKGRTVFIIAHRLTAVRHADRIIVLDKGRIIEQGDHGDLLQQQGDYARLHAMQTA